MNKTANPNMNKNAGIKKYLPAGTWGMSLLLHLAIFLSISGVVLIQAVPSKTFFTAESGTVEPADLMPPEVPDDFTDPHTAAGEPAAADDLTPAFASVAIEQITSAAASHSTFNLLPQIGAVTGSAEGVGSGGVPGGTGSGGGKRLRAINPFGDRSITDGALIGHMYDLKQTADRRPSKFAPDSARQDYLDFVKGFIAGGFNLQQLAPYYKVAQPIGNYQIFIPQIDASEAPKAFHAEKYVAPKRWLIIYTGTFVAPASGTFRFVGMGDDILVVRLNGRVVQDASLHAVTGGRRESLGKPYPKAFSHFLMYAGEWFTLEKNSRYDLEILLGENPGGDFAAFLEIQEQGVTYPQKPDYVPALPVFQLRPVAIPANPRTAPPVAPEPFVVK